MMKNKYFEIDFEPADGTISSIVSPLDPFKMNWCSQEKCWGAVKYTERLSVHQSIETEFVSFQEDEDKAISVYENKSLRITVEREFDSSGWFTERYTFRNLRDSDLFLKHGDIGIAIPLNDRYTYAEECMTGKCNSHLWCGHHTAYINALKMGESDTNMGLILTKGAIDSYSLCQTRSNNRGVFVLNCAHMELRPHEETVLEWKLFIHKGNGDFYEKVRISPQFIRITAKNHTVFEDEAISFTVEIPDESQNLQVLLEDQPIPFEQKDGKAYVTYQPKRLGEYRFTVKLDGTRTYTEFFVAEKFDRLIEKRINFIIDKQQYHCETSSLNGAYLIYDTKEKQRVFDTVIRDHNACRERIGMPLLITKYLQKYEDEKLKKSLESYIAFVKREFYDEESGAVFDGIGKRGPVRLYNAPWLITLFTELYLLFKDEWYLDNILKMLTNYYENGGANFYPNGLSIYNTFKAFEDSGRKADTEKVLHYFKAHVDNMVKNGLSYPKHEVHYEQTIVSPAATFISEMGRITGDLTYAEEAEKHIGVLQRFSGHQPSFHLNEIPIRYWDDFWFGKSRLFGDTFPHYWSCLTARAYLDYYRLEKRQPHLTAAEECLRNCLCLFNEKGEGSCAYVYPFRLNQESGQFYDEWANDQDFALYFAMESGLFEY